MVQAWPMEKGDRPARSLAFSPTGPTSILVAYYKLPNQSPFWSWLRIVSPDRIVTARDGGWQLVDFWLVPRLGRARDGLDGLDGCGVQAPQALQGTSGPSRPPPHAHTISHGPTPPAVPSPSIHFRSCHCRTWPPPLQPMEPPTASTLSMAMPRDWNSKYHHRGRPPPLANHPRRPSTMSSTTS